ncbi:MAG: DNA primase, partial [Acidimicrobiaceae bacterium]|nr:DNA primase [Acidimicrobiaceae bacterium]
MGIMADDIARVRAATDIVAIIGEHTEIKRSGRQWMARCPLHGERTPSLSVSPDKGVYYCFGCQRSGDVITFVQEIEGLDFGGAVEMLAGRAGIHLHYTSRDESAARSRRRRLLEAVARARDFYHQRLLDGRDAGPARNYLRSRGYDSDLVRRWKIGWAPAHGEILAHHVGLSDDDLRDSGLGRINDRGSQYDFFRGRILFPINDERGDTVGFGGRVMPGVDGPKYMNTSTEAKTYNKSRVLYGLHEHRKEIVKAGRA